MMQPSVMRFLADISEVVDKHTQALGDDFYESTGVKIDMDGVTYTLYEEGWEESEDGA